MCLLNRLLGFQLHWFHSSNMMMPIVRLWEAICNVRQFH